MNDFTKEELHTLADGIVLIKNMCMMRDEVRNNLEKLDHKLCLMINNYCEHTNSNSTFVCDDCGEIR